MPRIKRGRIFSLLNNQSKIKVMKKFETTLVALTTIFTALYFLLLDHMLEQHINLITFTIVLLSSLMYLAWMISVLIVGLQEDTKDTLL